MVASRSKVQDLPVKVQLSLVAEDEDVAEPFRFEAPDGSIIELTDPRELTIDEMSTLQQPLEFLRFTASEEDRTKMRTFRGSQMSKVIKAYFEHFGIPTEEGKGIASPF